MAQESDANPKQPIPISKARSKRESSPKIETSAEEIRKIMADVVQEKVTAEISRLKTSINRMMDHIEAVTNGEAEDSALRVTTDHGIADLAVAGIDLKIEDYYVYTTSELAEKLQVRIHDIVQMVKILNLKGNKQYHKEIKTGKAGVQKYSESTLIRLNEALNSGEYQPPQRKLKITFSSQQ